MAQKNWDLSSSIVRIETERPIGPNLDTATDHISAIFSKAKIRAFHATRLVDPAAISRSGLLALDRRAHLARVAVAFRESNAPDSELAAVRLEHWLATSDKDFDSESREGDCWLTPSRRLLHEGGLDEIFAAFGG